MPRQARLQIAYQLIQDYVNVILFRAFNLSCFRYCVSEFSPGKNAEIITKSSSKNNLYILLVLLLLFCVASRLT